MVVLCALLIFSLVFFKERMLCLDACFQSFEVIKQPNKIFEWFRFGSFFPRLVISLGIMLHLNLKNLILLQSVSFVAVHVICFFICKNTLKQEKWALVVPLFCIFFVNNTFYWAQNELIQAMAFNCVFWAYLCYYKEKATLTIFNYALIAIFVFTLAFFHPLVPFPFLFTALFFLFEKGNSKQFSKTIYLSMALLVFFTILRVVFLEEKYDHQASARFNFSRVLPFLSHLGEQPGWQAFIKHLFNDFWLLPASILIICFHYLRVKAYRKITLILSFMTGYCLLVMMSYNESGNWFHVESQYLPASLFLIIPVIFDVIPAYSINLKSQNLILTALILVVAIRLFQIYKTHNFYTNRLEYISSILDLTKNKNGTKFMVEAKDIDKEKILNTWAFAYESLYVSALHSPDSTRSICVVDSLNSRRWMLNESKSFFSIWDIVPYAKLDRHYFNFKDSTNNYQYINLAH